MQSQRRDDNGNTNSWSDRTAIVFPKLSGIVTDVELLTVVKTVGSNSGPEAVIGCYCGVQPAGQIGSVRSDGAVEFDISDAQCEICLFLRSRSRVIRHELLVAREERFRHDTLPCL